MGNIKMVDSHLNVSTLKGLIKIFKIKNYSKLNKNQLISLINKYHAQKIISKYFKKYICTKTDNITLENVEYPCFIIRFQNTTLYYNYHSIIHYIIKTGDTRDPMTRIEYSDTDLLRLDREAKKNGLIFKSTFKIKKNVNYSKKIMRLRNEIAAYELRINEIIEYLKIAVESDILSWDFNLPFTIFNVQYINTSTYIKSLGREIKKLIEYLHTLDSDLSQYYKEKLTNTISTNEKINKLIFT